MNQANIEIFCNNVQKSNPTTHAILEDIPVSKPNIQIIIITEPWIGQVRTDTQEKGTVRHHLWNCWVPTKIENARVAIYARKNCRLRIIPLLHLPYANEHILPVEISDGKKSITLIAVYNT